VTTQNNTQLACFFTESSRKPHQTNVSPSKQRGRESMKTGCKFFIRAANHPKMKKTAKRHRTPVRISSLELKHGEQCQPGLTEQRMAKKAAGAVFGALDLTRLGSIINIIADGHVNTAQIRNLLKMQSHQTTYVTFDRDASSIRLKKRLLTAKPPKKSSLSSRWTRTSPSLWRIRTRAE
jgi:hypothetical protein